MKKQTDFEVEDAELNMTDNATQLDEEEAEISMNIVDDADDEEKNSIKEMELLDEDEEAKEMTTVFVSANETGAVNQTAEVDLELEDMSVDEDDESMNANFTDDADEMMS